jgi:hypothetical protein
MVPRLLTAQEQRQRAKYLEKPNSFSRARRLFFWPRPHLNHISEGDTWRLFRLRFYGGSACRATRVGRDKRTRDKTKGPCIYD